jgi:hypothetical protein
VELKLSKSAAREEYQNQMNSLKREINMLKIRNDELSVKLS